MPLSQDGEPTALTNQQGGVQDFDSTENRQYHGSDVHKQSGRHSLQRLSLPDKESLDVVPGEKHTHNCSVSSRIPEHGCRCGVSNGDRQDRLETEPSDISKNRSVVWSTGSGPICNPSVISMPMLLQLAARSLCRSHRRLPTELDSLERLHQSPIESDRQNTMSGSVTTSQDSATSSGMENTTVVSDSPIDPDRLP